MVGVSDTPSTIDVERYPLHKLDAEAGRNLVEQCRRDVVENSLCQLPGFLKASTVKTAAAEALRCGESAYHMSNEFTYGEGMPYAIDPDVLPKDDPRRYRIRTKLRFVASDEIPSNSLLLALYRWEPMLQFVSRVFQCEPLYRASDKLNGLNYLVYENDDEQDWHFDEQDFSVTILLQSAEQGGFEFVPNLRGADGEDLDGMRLAQQGEHPKLVRPKSETGTLSLFEGRYNYHRATRVVGPRKRLMALLQYYDEPYDPMDSETVELNRMFYGRGS